MITLKILNNAHFCNKVNPLISIDCVFYVSFHLPLSIIHSCKGPTNTNIYVLNHITEQIIGYSQQRSNMRTQRLIILSSYYVDVYIIQVPYSARLADAAKRQGWSSALVRKLELLSCPTTMADNGYVTTINYTPKTGVQRKGSAQITRWLLVHPRDITAGNTHSWKCRQVGIQVFG